MHLRITTIMAIPKYRIIDEKGAYMPRSPEVQLLQLGADHQAARVYGIRAAICELLPMDTEIEFDGIPGPHLKPLNDEAQRRLDEYWAKHPNATLDPTRHLPLGQDPMGGRSIEQLVTGLPEAMDRERRVEDALLARGAAAVESAQAMPPGGQIAALVESQRAMTDGVARLTAALSGMVAAGVSAGIPPKAGRAG
jgi:hypothetical protein